MLRSSEHRDGNPIAKDVPTSVTAAIEKFMAEVADVTPVAFFSIFLYAL